MDEAKFDSGMTFESHLDARRALIACGLWMRAGFVGASAAAAAIVLLIGGQAAAMPTVAAALGGIAAAVLAWRRAYVVLERADAAESAPATVGRPVTTRLSTGY